MSKIRKILFVFIGVLFISLFLTTIAWSCATSDLRIEKSGPDCVVPGDNITYTICVWNAGSGVADGVMISDTIPAGTTFVSATGDYTGPDPDCVVWNLGSIAVDKVCVTLTVQVDPNFDISTDSTDSGILQNYNPQPVISNTACGFTGSCSELNCSVSVITTIKESCDVVCGNGLLEGMEECDDGNTVDGDGCSSDCKLEYCGDGEMDQGEECDDGNTVDGDGCSSDCKLEYCGDGIIQPGLNEECDDGNNVDGDGCSANCELEFECGECKGKVTELTLSYLGAVGANIAVYEGKDPKPEKNVFSAFVLPGEIFSFSGAGVGKDITLGTEISIYVDGVLNTKIHTSCSQPIGPGLIRGDFEVVEGISKDGGLLCPVPPPSPDDCECEGKVTELTLSYLGADAANIAVYEGKDPKPENNVFSALVLPGEIFSFNGTGVGKDITLGTEISIYVDGVLNTKIHTSCSQPIGPGLISGDFEVIEGSSKKGGDLCPVPPPSPDDCECEGKVTELTLSYLGADAANIAVYEGKDPKPEKNVFSAFVLPGEIFSFNGTGVGKDMTLGTEISIYVDGELNTKIHTSCSQPIGPGLISGDFEVIEGSSKKGGDLCPVPPSSPDDCECEGKVTELTLSYLGADAANIEVYEGKDPKPEKNVFSAFVLSGEIFSFNGTGVGKDMTLGTEISIYVDGELNTKIHTSCSQPIGPGLISGDFEVIEGSSKKGGDLCPL